MPGSTKSKTSSRKRTAFKVAKVLELVLVPWLLYAAVSAAFAFGYHMLSEVIWATFAILLVGAGLFTMLSASERPMHMYLGVLSTAGIVVGACVGFTCYQLQLSHFWFLNDGHVYTNVLPSDPAAGYVDAGKLLFTEDSRVDTSKSLGYQDGDTYCVAPIIDGSDTGDVEFWAAGVNCCAARGNFICDDAFEPDARGGAIIRSVSALSVDVRDKYALAVKQAEAAFEIASTADPLFVRWVQDPQLLQDDFWHVGCGIIIAGLGVYLLLQCIFVCLIATITHGDVDRTA